MRKSPLLLAISSFAAPNSGNSELKKFNKKVFFFACFKQSTVYMKSPIFPLV